jgi:Cu-Zn family superoxide dismutase
MNEVWLDFTTDAKGNATKAATVDWAFGAAPASSVVIHAEPTKTAPGQAGMAGARAACVSIAF